MQNGDKSGDSRKSPRRSPRRRSRSPRNRTDGGANQQPARRGGSAANFDNDNASNSSSDGQSDDDYAWIPWFCSLKGNEFFAEVDDSFAQDGFNLTGLNQLVPYYDYALDMILDIEPNPEDMLSDDQQEMVENDAENLFGLIHARFILTNRGLHAMLEKYRQVHFGRCPRVLCRGQPVLPVGLSDTVNQESVKVYCPRCEEVYHSKSSRHEHIDGAYFGTTFPHLFFLTFPELKVPKSTEVYVPRVFGFRVNKHAYKRSLEARKKAIAGQEDGDDGEVLQDPGDEDKDIGPQLPPAESSAATPATHGNGLSTRSESKVERKDKAGGKGDKASARTASQARGSDDEAGRDVKDNSKAVSMSVSGSATTGGGQDRDERREKDRERVQGQAAKQLAGLKSGKGKS